LRRGARRPAAAPASSPSSARRRLRRELTVRQRGPRGPGAGVVGSPAPAFLPPAPGILERARACVAVRDDKVRASVAVEVAEPRGDARAPRGAVPDLGASERRRAVAGAREGEHGAVLCPDEKVRTSVAIDVPERR